MVQRRSKRKTKKRNSNKSIGLIYYKMNHCKYCKEFERKLLPQLIHYCRKKDLRFYIVVRELNPELIPKRIKTFPSLVKYDKNYKITIFNNERKLNNLKKFLN
tara:strand:- start:95 stop:403 length:309 start_codon:yes stop_codon:yes gene_type:complete